MIPTAEEFLEGNKLIAEFDNKKWDIENNRGRVGLFVLDSDAEIAYELDYHSSWDWLMPVVEKIQHLENKLPVRIDFQIYLLGAVELHIDYKRVFGMSAFEPGTLINAVYEGVIEFIKWYNEQKK